MLYVNAAPTTIDCEPCSVRSIQVLRTTHQRGKREKSILTGTVESGREGPHKTVHTLRKPKTVNFVLRHQRDREDRGEGFVGCGWVKKVF